MYTFEPANYIENEAKDSVFFVIFDQSILSFSNENFIRPLTQDELTWSYIEEKERHFLLLIINRDRWNISRVKPLFTKYDNYLTRSEVLDLLAWIPSFNGELPKPDISADLPTNKYPEWFPKYKYPTKDIHGT